MKLTLSIDDRLVQQARKMAESTGTSLRQLIRDYLGELTSQSNPEAEIEELRRLPSQATATREAGGSTVKIHERT